MPNTFEAFHVKSSGGGYDVVIGDVVDLVSQAGLSDMVVLADVRFKGRLPVGEDRAILIQSDETEKSLERMAPLIERMKAMGVNRKTHVVAVGGGIIQDIATFVASIYMRGLRWTYVPTTLLAMVDSCIGGKSSINVGKLKNLVGGFHPPEKVIVDTRFVDTLDNQQIIDGLCEAAKICYARGVFSDFHAAVANKTTTADLARDIVLRSLSSKRWFVEEDEFDQGVRLLLNFGHTFGHAIEAASDFRVSHGVAVGIGILVAHVRAERAGRYSRGRNPTFDALASYVETLLYNLPGLTDVLTSLRPMDVVSKFEGDKKHWADRFRVVIPVDGDHLELTEFPRSETERSEISEAFAGAFARVGASMSRV